MMAGITQGNEINIMVHFLSEISDEVLGVNHMDVNTGDGFDEKWAQFIETQELLKAPTLFTPLDFSGSWVPTHVSKIGHECLW